MKSLFSHRFYPWAVCAALALLLPSTRAAEDGSTQALQALETALHDEAAAPKPALSKGQETDGEESDYAGRRGDVTSNWTSQLRAYLEQGESEQAERLLSQVTVYSKSEAVSKACKTLREQIRHERETREQAALKRYRDAAADAEGAVKSARVPADLDAALRELSVTSNTQEYRASGAVQAEVNRIQNLRRYVILWQDYLVSLQHGDKQTALEKLRSISQEGSSEIFPRSELLARMEELKTSERMSVANRAEAILGKLKTLDQMAEVIIELDALRTRSGSDYTSSTSKINVDNVISDLQSYTEIYHTYQAGLPASVESVTGRSWSGQQPPVQVQTMKAQLLRLLCERQFNLRDRSKADENESLPDYLNRVLADARERGDARMIMRVRDIQRQLNSRNGSSVVPTSPEATSALQALLAAQNQEEAGQFIPAVVSYENALKNGSDVVPAKIIGAHLDAIKSAHPVDYEKGMQISLGASNGTGAGNIPAR